MFEIATTAIDPDSLRKQLFNDAAGAYCGFEGWVRNHNDGHIVRQLEYEAYAPVAVQEAEKIFAEARDLAPYLTAYCVHRTGLLEVGDCAVWVGVCAPHRDEAFQACRYIIDQVKVRLPIWKKEHYVDGNSGWVNCERCAKAG